MSNIFVRLKPYDPVRGQVLQRFSYKGICFYASRGWYTPPETVADYLRTVRQRHDDPHSPLAFDVCTEEEARAIDTKETQEEQPKRPVDNAQPVAPREEPDEPKPAQAPKRGRARKAKPDHEPKTEETEE